VSHKNSFSLSSHLTSSSKSSENSLLDLTTFLDFLNQVKILKNSESQLKINMTFNLHISFFSEQAKALNVMMSNIIEKAIQTVFKNIQSII